MSLRVGEGVIGVQAPQPLSPTQPYLPCLTGGSAQADGDTYQELCASQL